MMFHLRNKMDAKQLSAFSQSELTRFTSGLISQYLKAKEEEEGKSTNAAALPEKQKEKGHVAFTAMDVDDEEEGMHVDDDEEDDVMDVEDDDEDDVMDDEDDDDDDVDHALETMLRYIRRRRMRKYAGKSLGGRKKYQCKKCKKAFSLKHNLRNHAAFCVDSGMKSCRYCSKQFSTPYCKRRHEAICSRREEVKPGQVGFG